jgi:hypothetical protein
MLDQYELYHQTAMHSTINQATWKLFFGSDAKVQKSKTFTQIKDLNFC